MANTYENPMALLPKNDFVASGPLGGAFAGLQAMYGLGGLEAGQRDQDLGYLDKLNTYENAVLDNPFKAAERLSKTYEQQDKAKQYEEGIPQAWARKKAAADMSDFELKPQVNEAKRKSIAAEDVTSAYQAMAVVGQDPKLSGAAQEQWDTYKKVLQGHGIKVPDKWDKTAALALKAHYDAAKVRLPFYQDMIKEYEKRQTLDVTHKYTADKGTEASMANTVTRATAAREIAEIKAKDRELALKDPLQIIQRQLAYEKSGDERFDRDVLLVAVTALAEKRIGPAIDEKIAQAMKAGQPNYKPSVQDYLEKLPPVYRQLLIDHGLLDDFLKPLDMKYGTKSSGQTTATQPAVSDEVTDKSGQVWIYKGSGDRKDQNNYTKKEIKKP